MFCFHAYDQVSLKIYNNKKIILYLHKKKSFSMHFDFNNQFIKVTRTGQYFKNSKKIYGVTTLYVRRISDIKFFC